MQPSHGSQGSRHRGQAPGSPGPASTSGSAALSQHAWLGTGASRVTWGISSLRGNRQKLKHRRFRLNTRRNFFSSRVRSPDQAARVAVEAPSLEPFKRLCHLLWWPRVSRVGPRDLRRGATACHEMALLRHAPRAAVPRAAQPRPAAKGRPCPQRCPASRWGVRWKVLFVGSFMHFAKPKMLIMVILACVSEACKGEPF